MHFNHSLAQITKFTIVQKIIHILSVYQYSFSSSIPGIRLNATDDNGLLQPLEVPREPLSEICLGNYIPGQDSQILSRKSP